MFWGAILAIIFAPLQRVSARLGNRRNMAALITLLLVLLLVIMPVAFISSLVREGANLYQSIKSGQLNFGAYFQQAMEALPPSVHDLLARFDLADIPSLQEKLSAGAMQVSQFLATQALSIGQDSS